MLGVNGLRYRHAASGAEVLHLASDEPNRSFAVAFPTLPSDDTGVAHILEHMVLAGSERYPLKDPFFEMVKGSVAGFLNAFTYPDRTIYPFATENERDFLNLLDVYLDAVFRPRLSRATFDQEAWHLKPSEDGASLSLHGVVFNEMKGAMADPGRSLGHVEALALFEGNPYAFESGGDPAAIPDLSYEALVAYHRAHYHPSRARFVLHGDVPFEDALARIARYLVDASPIEEASPPPLQPAFAAPRSASGSYPADAHGGALASVAWTLPALEGPGEELMLEVLDHVLVGTPASPLRRALLDAELGEAFLGGLDLSVRQPNFRAGLRGVNPERVPDVHALVLDTLEEVSRVGFDPADVRAARNRLEFDLREMDGQGGQRGLTIALDALGSWLHGRDPLRSLDYDAALADLNARLGDGEDHGAGALVDVMRSRLLENPHRVAAHVVPDGSWSERRSQQEAERLATLRAGLGEGDVTALREANEALMKAQMEPDSEEARATLPRLHRDDLHAMREDPVTTLHTHEGARVLHVNLPTRGLAYLDVGFDLQRVPTRLLPHVGMLGRYLMETGTAQRSLSDLTRAIDADTGGVDAGFDLAPPAPSGVQLARFFVRGRALAQKVETLTALMREVALEANLADVPTLRMLAKESLARRRAALERAGHRYALRRVASHDSVESRAEERMTGLAGLAELARFIERCDEEPDAVVAELAELRSLLFHRDGLVVGVTADDAAAEVALPAVRAFIDGLPSTGGASESWAFDPPGEREGWTLPGQVNYVVTGRTLQGGRELPGGWLVASRWLSSEVMLPRIRFEGGAYGAGAMLDPLRGAFRTYSYRDPHVDRTLGVVAEAPALLREAAASLDEVEFETLVIGAVGSLEPYDAPAERGYRTLVRWLRGTEEQPARLRRELLEADRSVFTALADAIEAADAPNVVVLGPRDALTSSQASLEVSDPG